MRRLLIVSGLMVQQMKALDMRKSKTEWHLSHRKVSTLVISQSSGSSFMNHVELQNGCLTQAHSDLFILSTLNGSCVKESGKLDLSVLHQNLNSAINIYIQRCNGCSCICLRVSKLTIKEGKK